VVLFLHASILFKPTLDEIEKDYYMKVYMVAYIFYETNNRGRRYAESLVNRGDNVNVIAAGKPGQRGFEKIRDVNCI